MSSKFRLPSGTIIEGSGFSYRIVDMLGQGSFGITYLVELLNAQGEPANIFMAMKEFFMNEFNGREGLEVTCNNENGLFCDYRRAFLDKARSMASVSCENFMKVTDCFEANNTAYFTKNYLEGGSLEDMVKANGKLAQLHALEIASLLAGAVKALHLRGIAHLDVRPGNVMMISGLVPVLIDFGIPHHFDADGKPETITRVGLGTPGYAPIEQASYRGELNIGEAIDVYGLGATLFRMLTGERPPEAAVILNGGFPEDTLRNAGADDRIIELIRKSMRPTIEERMTSVDDFASAVREILSDRFGISSAASISEVISKAVSYNVNPAIAEETSVTMKSRKPAEDSEQSDDSDLENPADVETEMYEAEVEEQKRELPLLVYVLGAVGIVIVGLIIYFFIMGAGKKASEETAAPADSAAVVTAKDSAVQDTVPSIEEAVNPIEEPAKEEDEALDRGKFKGKDKALIDKRGRRRGEREAPRDEGKAPAKSEPDASPSPAPAPTAPSPAQPSQSSTSEI